MNWLSTFWSRGRNRAFIYSFGILAVLGSYVIGAPEVHTAKSKTAKKTRLEATTSSTSDVQDVAPVTNLKEEATDNSVPVTPTTASIPGTKIASAPKAFTTHSSDSSHSGEMFDPVAGREISEAQQKALEKELHRAEVDYPYEISAEEKRLTEESNQRTLTPKERDQRLAMAMFMGNQKKLNSTKEQNQKQNAQTNLNSPSQTSASGAHKQTAYTFYPNKNKTTSTENSDGVYAPDAGESSSNYNKGTVLDAGRKKYQDIGFYNIPAEWNFTHQNLEIYQFTPGDNAGLIPKSWASHVPVYTWVKNKKGAVMYGQLHDKYRIPPDWDNLWKFSDDKSEEIKISQIVSNKHLLSLGTNGSIIFAVTNGKLTNEEGYDFVIWSHPNCYIKTDKTDQELNQNARKEYQQYNPNSGRAISGIENGVECMKELAKVYVSTTGPATDEWTPIEPCEKNGDDMSSKCAGYGLNLWPQVSNPFNPVSGGDRYDLSDVSLGSINAIKIVDLNNKGEYEKGGFDLDAIAMIHFQQNQVVEGKPK